MLFSPAISAAIRAAIRANSVGSSVEDIAMVLFYL